MSSTAAPNYRVRILTDLFRALVIPPIITYSIITSFIIPLGLSFLLCALSIPLTIIVHTYWNTYVQEAKAHRLGARLVTRVKGRYPGNIDILLSMVKQHREGYIHDFHRQIFHQYGETTLNYRFLWKDAIFTIDEGNMKYVLSTGFEKFSKGYFVRELLENFLGNGIFNRDGAEWKAHRSLLRPFFVRERISDFRLFDKYAHETLTVLDKASSQPYHPASMPDGAKEWEHKATPVDIQDLFARFTLDSASIFLFGECTNALKGPLPIAGRSIMGAKGSMTEDTLGTFAAAFEEAQTVSVWRIRYGSLVWPLREFFHDKMNEPMEIINAWLEPVVQRALKERKAKKAETEAEEGPTTLIEHLVETSDDPVYIRSELLNILLASRDTTASLLTFITYLFAMHPEVATRLRAEVLETCGRDGSPNFETLRGMRYMRAVLNEALRLFPPVPQNLRQSVSDTVLPPAKPNVLQEFPNSSTSQGLYIPGNTLVTYLMLEIHHRKDLWGADADSFDPDRWLDSRLQRYTENPMMFTPFNAGPRICLGQNFAYNEASYFLIKLLQRYDAFMLAPDAQPPASYPPSEWRRPGKMGRQTFERIWPASAMTIFSKGGLWMRLRRASDV